MHLAYSITWHDIRCKKYVDQAVKSCRSFHSSKSTPSSPALVMASVMERTLRSDRNATWSLQRSPPYCWRGACLRARGACVVRTYVPACGVPTRQRCDFILLDFMELWQGVLIYICDVRLFIIREYQRVGRWFNITFSGCQLVSQYTCTTDSSKFISGLGHPSGEPGRSENPLIDLRWSVRIMFPDTVNYDSGIACDC